MGPPVRDLPCPAKGRASGHDHRAAALPERGADAARLEPVAAVRAAKAQRLEEVHGEIAQEQTFIAPGGVHLLERVVQDLDQLAVALLHRDADTLAEIFGVEIGTAAELAAPVAGHAVEPEGEPDTVAEHEIDLSAFQRHLRLVGAVERHGLGGREILLEKSLMAGAARHGDLLALYGLGTDILVVALLARDEARGRRVIAAGEIGLGQRTQHRCGSRRLRHRLRHCRDRRRDPPSPPA